jgi:hypothetical protein
VDKNVAGSKPGKLCNGNEMSIWWELKCCEVSYILYISGCT